VKFYDKYPQLQKEDFLLQLLTDTVYTTMSLENQSVPRPKVRQIISSLLKEETLKGNQFFIVRKFSGEKFPLSAWRIASIYIFGFLLPYNIS